MWHGSGMSGTKQSRCMFVIEIHASSLDLVGWVLNIWKSSLDFTKHQFFLLI